MEQLVHYMQTLAAPSPRISIKVIGHTYEQRPLLQLAITSPGNQQKLDSLRQDHLQGQGPLVLLLHGFPDTAHTWDEVRPALAEAGYRAVSPFMRGYAPTEVPADGKYDSDTLGQDVLALIDALGGGPAIVVGHDWGASAAYSAVGLGPERIRFLVTVAVPHPASLKPSPRLVWGWDSV